jgi:mannosyltransferase OCH1-like enzyme
MLQDANCELITFLPSYHAGMYKADICRAAYLYLRGGYYFDIDVLGEYKMQSSFYH